MEPYYAILKRCPLFAGIAPDEMKALLGCLGAVRRSFQKDEVILLAGTPAGTVGVLLSGRAQVLREDADGNRLILTALASGELFAEAFACAHVEALPVTVMAAERCETLTLDYRRVIATCSSACAFHNRLIENMLAVVAQKNLMLNRRIDYLSRRSTREKLIAYLTDEAMRAGADTFTIPFDRQELADFLSVDRSAMSGVLGRLRDEGLIAFSRSRFTVHF